MRDELFVLVDRDGRERYYPAHQEAIEARKELRDYGSDGTIHVVTVPHTPRELCAWLNLSDRTSRGRVMR